MKTTDIELLEHMVKSTEMGMDGINNVLDKVKEKKLRDELRDEYSEYKDIHSQACEMLAQRGEGVKNISAFAKMSSEMMVDIETAFNQSSSKLADMMIKGTVMGVNKSVKLLNSYDGHDESVKSLCERLRTLEENRINNLKAYL